MDLDQYFGAYGDALASGDVDTIVAHYGFPCAVLTDDYSGTLDTPDALRGALSQAVAFYRQFGFTGARPEILDVDEVTAKITRVRVRWHYTGADGAELTDSTYDYVLRSDPDRPHIYWALSLDEQQKLTELQARLAATS